MWLRRISPALGFLVSAVVILPSDLWQILPLLGSRIFVLTLKSRTYVFNNSSLSPCSPQRESNRLSMPPKTLHDLTLLVSHFHPFCATITSRLTNLLTVPQGPSYLSKETHVAVLCAETFLQKHQQGPARTHPTILTIDSIILSKCFLATNKFQKLN